MKKSLLLLFLELNLMIFSVTSFGQINSNRFWKISAKNEIQLELDKKGVLPYTDNIEMSGKRVAAIILYSIDTLGKLSIERKVFFPQLHQFKTSESSWFFDYRAYLQDVYKDNLLPKLYINDQQYVPGAIKAVTINGKLNFEHQPSKNGLSLTRTLFPSMDERLFVELWTITNITNLTMQIKTANTSLVYEDYGAKGKYTRKITSNAPEIITLKPGENITFSMNIEAKIEGEEFPKGNATEELEKRNDFLKTMAGSLQLETPNPVLNTLFEFSKIRASESIYESELGLIHSPGGGRYYVGIWANDQAEYVSPFFPYLGYDIGNQSAMNCYWAFAKEINPGYNKIRYSFEVEGLVKPFLLDRGDAAMIAYGATHFALASGDEKLAKELWTLIEWCLEYCNRQLNTEGVVASESDEMEGRIETGTANLSTSSLYYGALGYVIDLGKSIGIEQNKINTYQLQLIKLGKAIENYFGANVEGLDTYKYYKEHQHLRHWICLPLVVGINARKEGTITALLDRLWTDNGIHVEKNSENEEITKIFWDRGTLYALRGTFYSGATEQSLVKLEQFSEKRLLGDHVPYVVEAYPEGNMAHLSAESGLYCRVFTEGVFGLQPTGLNSFKIKPRLPIGWETMSLSQIKAFGEDFNITVTRINGKIEIKISSKGKNLITKKLNAGDTFEFSFK